MKLNIAVLLVLITTSCANSNKETDTRTHYSHTPAKRWQDALISGNGSMGVMVFGNPDDETIILNHELLYEFLGTEEILPPNIAVVIPKVKELIKGGKYKEAKALTLAEAAKKGHPDILWTDPYHPACALKLKQSFKGNVSEYKRTTNTSTGEIEVRWQANETKFSRKAFVSRTDNVIALKLEASKQNSINANMLLDELVDRKKILENPWSAHIQKNIEFLHPRKHTDFSIPYIHKPEKSIEEDMLALRVNYQVYDRGYEVIVHVKNNGGKIYLENNTLEIKDAGSIELLMRIIPFETSVTSIVKETMEELKQLENYDRLLEKHSALHNAIVSRVELSLSKDGYTDAANETLIKEQKKLDSINPFLLEKLFNMGVYGLVSSSGQNPPNLMGIWNGDWRPNWSGDFTLDANINLQIAGANLADLPEAIESYMLMLERISPDWEINAKNLYGCRGYVSGIRTSGRRGLQTHFADFPGHYWTAGAEWLLLPCYEYYLCSGDKEFLTKRLLPIMMKVALFYEDFLDTYDVNGKLLFAPSFSPENSAITPEGKQLAVANATMDIAAAKELLTNIITVCEDLDIEQDKVLVWREMLNKFPPYLINKDGALKEWAHPKLGDNYNHRHVSHLYPVWPGHEITPESGDLYEAAKVAIQKRGRGDGSAHGLIITALIAARLKDADLVYNNLLYLLKNNYLYSNLFTSHNPGAIFNSDALHALPAVILEMLVYSNPGIIELLPACSNKFENGTVKGVKCRTQATINKLEWNFQTKQIKTSIMSDKNQVVHLVCREGIKRLQTNGKARRKTESIYEFELKKDEIVYIEIIMGN